MCWWLLFVYFFLLLPPHACCSPLLCVSQRAHPGEGAKKAAPLRGSLSACFYVSRWSAWCAIIGGTRSSGLKRTFFSELYKTGLLSLPKGKCSEDEHAGTKLHCYCEGCHQDVVAEQPDFYDLSSATCRLGKVCF